MQLAQGTKNVYLDAEPGRDEREGLHAGKKVTVTKLTNQTTGWGIKALVKAVDTFLTPNEKCSIHGHNNSRKIIKRIERIDHNDEPYLLRAWVKAEDMNPTSSGSLPYEPECLVQLTKTADGKGFTVITFPISYGVNDLNVRIEDD